MRYIDIPAKVLQCFVSSVVGIAQWPYNDGAGDPYWQGGTTPVDYQWEMTVEVDPQSHSSYKTRNPYSFDAMDVRPGLYIASAQTGIALKIVSIISKTTTTVQMIVEDTLRYNTFRDPQGIGTGIFQTPSQAIIFELNEDGMPVIDPVPPNGISQIFYVNLMSRFQNLEPNSNFILHKPNHGFVRDQVISVDPVNNTFVLADADHPYTIGTVSYTYMGPNYFAINPIQKVLDNIDSLIGGVGDVIYANPLVPGGLTTTAGQKPIMIKLRNNTQTSITGTVSSGTTDVGANFYVNGVLTEVAGTGSAADFVDAINLNTSEHGVTASEEGAPTVVETTLTTMLGEPAHTAPVGGPFASATINGVLVTFSTTTVGLALYGDYYALEEDMATDINAANIPNIVASTDINKLILTNTAGGAITIVNVDADNGGAYFAGPNSGSGLELSTPPSTNTFVKLTAVDARAIDLLDRSGYGTPTADFGLYSVENGQKAAALYVEQGLRTASITVVPNIAGRDALTPIIGDQAYVLDKGDEEWGLYMFNGDAWALIATEESAKTDADTYMVEITHESDLDGIIGEMNDNSRVNTVAVRVIEPFVGGNATISVGTETDHDLLMTIDQNDLLAEGEYATTPTYVFDVGADTTVHYYLALNGATSGRAQVSISYS